MLFFSNNILKPWSKVKHGFGSSLFSFFYASPAFVPFAAGMAIFLLLCISLNGLTNKVISNIKFFIYFLGLLYCNLEKIKDNILVKIVHESNAQGITLSV